MQLEHIELQVETRISLQRCGMKRAIQTHRPRRQPRSWETSHWEDDSESGKKNHNKQVEAIDQSRKSRCTRSPFRRGNRHQAPSPSAPHSAPSERVRRRTCQKYGATNHWRHMKSETTEHCEDAVVFSRVGYSSGKSDGTIGERSTRWGFACVQCWAKLQRVTLDEDVQRRTGSPTRDVHDPAPAAFGNDIVTSTTSSVAGIFMPILAILLAILQRKGKKSNWQPEQPFGVNNGSGPLRFVVEKFRVCCFAWAAWRTINAFRPAGTACIPTRSRRFNVDVANHVTNDTTLTGVTELFKGQGVDFPPHDLRDAEELLSLLPKARHLHFLGPSGYEGTRVTFFLFFGEIKIELVAWQPRRLIDGTRFGVAVRGADDQHWK